MNSVIRFFSSVRLALWLILLLALDSLAGTLLRQIPPAFLDDPALKQAWMEQVAEPAYGVMANVYNFFGLFDVFHSPIFIVLGSLLIINITVCSLKRWNSLVKTSRGVDPEDAGRLLDKGHATRATTRLSAAENEAAVKSFFKQRGFRLRRQSTAAGTVFVADKNRFAPWGTYAIHVSLILLIVGYLIGSVAGYENKAFTVGEGQTREIGAGYDFSLRLISFEDEYYDSGAPKDYRAQVEIIENGQVVKEALVRVNYPLEHDGLKIYQDAFGPDTTNIRVSSADGTELFHEGVAFTQGFADDEGVTRFSGSFELPDQNLFVFIFSSAGLFDYVVPANSVRLEFYDSPQPEGQFLDALSVPIGGSAVFQDLAFTADSQSQFSSFILREDPGLGMIWAAFALFMVGLGVVFYFPHRQMIVSISPDTKGSRCVYLAHGKKAQSADELDAFASAISATGQIQPRHHERKSAR